LNLITLIVTGRGGGGGGSLKLLSREKIDVTPCGGCRLSGTLGHISATQFKSGTAKGLGAGDGEQVKLSETKRKMYGLLKCLPW